MLIAETNPRNHAGPIIIRAPARVMPLEQRKDRSYLSAAVTRPSHHSLPLSIATVSWNSIAISLLPWLGIDWLGGRGDRRGAAELAALLRRTCFGAVWNFRHAPRFMAGHGDEKSVCCSLQLWQIFNRAVTADNARLLPTTSRRF